MDESNQNAIKRYIEINPYRDTEQVVELINGPVSNLVAVITGGLAQSKADWITAGGRLLQAALKGRFYHQFVKELGYMKQTGEIPEDFENKKHGFQTLVELMEFIDNTSIDEERFLAIKAMFFAINSVETSEGQAVVLYQLFQISKKLSSSQLLLLNVVYKWYLEGNNKNPEISSYNYWRNEICKRIGHSIYPLIDQDESVLTDLGLLVPRLYSDKTGADLQDVRLTSLGVLFCENIDKYKQAAK